MADQTKFVGRSGLCALGYIFREVVHCVHICLVVRVSLISQGEVVVSSRRNVSA